MCAPAAPNYVGAAQAQGAANVEAARTSAHLSNPNIIGPRGTQTVSYGSFDQAGFDQANQAYQQQLDQYNAQQGEPGGVQPIAANGTPNPSTVGLPALPGGGGGNISQIDSPFAPGGQTRNGMQRPTAPTREQFMRNQDDPTVTQTLSPQEQAIFDQTQNARLGLANTANQGVSNVQGVLGQPFNFQQYLQGGQGGQGAHGGYRASGTPPPMNSDGSYQRVPMNGMQYAGGTPNFNEGGGPSLGGGMMGGGTPSGGMMGGGGGGGQSGIPQQSINTSGIARMPVNAGMTGQNAIMSRLQPQIDRERAQLNTQLTNQGLSPGSEAYNNQMTLQSQRENDMLNQAALSGVNLDLTANQQGFGQAQAQGQFSNTALAQALQQALTQRELPLNEATALMSGSQMGLPQFQGYGGQQVQAPNIAGAMQNQGNYATGVYNSQMGGLTGLLGSGLMYAALA